MSNITFSTCPASFARRMSASRLHVDVDHTSSFLPCCAFRHLNPTARETYIHTYGLVDNQHSRFETTLEFSG
jgi:hypothetical protein